MLIFAAIYNFVGADEHKLRLDVGDAVNIICQSEGKTQKLLYKKRSLCIF